MWKSIKNLIFLILFSWQNLLIIYNKKGYNKQKKIRKEERNNGRFKWTRRKENRRDDR